MGLEYFLRSENRFARTRTPEPSFENVTSEYELVSPLAFARGMDCRINALYCGAGMVSSLT